MLMDDDSGGEEEDHKLPIHVSHTGYWSQGVDVSNLRADSVRQAKQLDVLCGEDRREQEFEEKDLVNSSEDGGEEDVRGVQEEQELGVWGLGLWGVWEAASSSPHFELQKGGVFRATPIVSTGS